MLAKVKKDLKEMKKDRPGERFKKQHRRAKEQGLNKGWGRAAFVGASLVSFAIGVVLVFIPGPAFVFFILSGLLLSSQWRWVAELMDRGEVKGREYWKKLRAWWKRKRGKSPRRRAKAA